jgi:hypothetical protein
MKEKNIIYIFIDVFLYNLKKTAVVLLVEAL